VSDCFRSNADAVLSCVFCALCCDVQVTVLDGFNFWNDLFAQDKMNSTASRLAKLQQSKHQHLKTENERTGQTVEKRVQRSKKPNAKQLVVAPTPAKTEEKKQKQKAPVLDPSKPGFVADPVSFVLPLFASICCAQFGVLMWLSGLSGRHMPRSEDA
jgi:hypothetical protein